MLATSDDWGATKPDVAFFHKLIEVSGHQPDEIAYVGDRLDNDIRPAGKAGLFTVWVRRGPWGYVQQPADSATPAAFRGIEPNLQLDALGPLRTRLDQINGEA